MATLPSGFIGIGPRISLYTPQQPMAGHLIIIYPWLGAAQKHIVKYITINQKIAPAARILLIESDISIITSNYQKQRHLIKPAISTVLDTLTECGYYVPPGEIVLNRDSSHEIGSKQTTKSPPKIFFHIFSNGGANSATQLLIGLHERLGQPLPVVGLVLDSCPGKGTYWKSQTALALSVRPKNMVSRIVADLIAHGILIILYAWIIVLGNENPASLMRRTLLDEKMLTSLVVGGSSENAVSEVKVRATYLYSKIDDQIDWREVKDHAEEARKKGWVVEEVEFEGSGHCAHFSKDSERYTQVIKSMWLARDPMNGLEAATGSSGKSSTELVK